MRTSGYQFLNGGYLFAVIVLLKGNELRPHVFDKLLAFGAFQLSKQFLFWSVRLHILVMKHGNEQDDSRIT